jgi:hypothetical protein
MLLGALKGTLFFICEAINMSKKGCNLNKMSMTDVNNFKTANRNKEVGLDYTATFVPPELCSEE